MKFGGSPMTQIAFTGDIAFTKYFSNSCDDKHLLDEEIVQFLSSTEIGKPLTHANPLECVEWIKKINGNTWNLANNHLMDCGLSGLKSTMSVIESKHLLKNERRKNTFHHPEYADRLWLDWLLKFDPKKCKKAPGREVIFGELLSVFCFWKLADKKVVNYICEK